MITFYLEAQSMEELRISACSALDLQIPGGIGAVTQAPPARDPVPEASDKPRRKHRATRLPVAAPDPVQEAMQDIGLMEDIEDDAVTAGSMNNFSDALRKLADEPLEISPEEALRGLTPVSTPLTDSLTNEKVKAEVIGQLADLFAAGKVKLLRGLLDQYGGGAKSFPEIDAARFPAIREALDRGIAA